MSREEVLNLVTATPSVINVNAINPCAVWMKRMMLPPTTSRNRNGNGAGGARSTSGGLALLLSTAGREIFFGARAKTDFFETPQPSGGIRFCAGKEQRLGSP